MYGLLVGDDVSAHVFGVYQELVQLQLFVYGLFGAPQFVLGFAVVDVDIQQLPPVGVGGVFVDQWAGSESQHGCLVYDSIHNLLDLTYKVPCILGLLALALLNVHPIVRPHHHPLKRPPIPNQFHTLQHIIDRQYFLLLHTVDNHPILQLLLANFSTQWYLLLAEYILFCSAHEDVEQLHRVRVLVIYLYLFGELLVDVYFSVLCTYYQYFYGLVFGLGVGVVSSSAAGIECLDGDISGCCLIIDEDIVRIGHFELQLVGLRYTVQNSEESEDIRTIQYNVKLVVLQSDRIVSDEYMLECYYCGVGLDSILYTDVVPRYYDIPYLPAVQLGNQHAIYYVDLLLAPSHQGQYLLTCHCHRHCFGAALSQFHNQDLLHIYHLYMQGNLELVIHSLVIKAPLSTIAQPDQIILQPIHIYYTFQLLPEEKYMLDLQCRLGLLVGLVGFGYLFDLDEIFVCEAYVSIFTEKVTFVYSQQQARGKIQPHYAITEIPHEALTVFFYSNYTQASCTPDQHLPLVNNLYSLNSRTPTKIHLKILINNFILHNRILQEPSLRNIVHVSGIQQCMFHSYQRLALAINCDRQVLIVLLQGLQCLMDRDRCALYCVLRVDCLIDVKLRDQKCRLVWGQVQFCSLTYSFINQQQENPQNQYRCIQIVCSYQHYYTIIFS